jgi:hypothetical protein
MSPRQVGVDPQGQNDAWREEVEARGYVRCSGAACPDGCQGQTFGIVYHSPEYVERATWVRTLFYEGDEPQSPEVEAARAAFEERGFRTRVTTTLSIEYPEAREDERWEVEYELAEVWGS